MGKDLGGIKRTAIAFPAIPPCYINLEPVRTGYTDENWRCEREDEGKHPEVL